MVDRCPGATDENPHSLTIISEETGNKLCINDRCYFLYEDKLKVGYWEPGFDPLKIGVNFLKPKKEK